MLTLISLIPFKVHMVIIMATLSHMLLVSQAASQDLIGLRTLSHSKI
jgi:hypothetical protein